MDTPYEFVSLFGNVLCLTHFVVSYASKWTSKILFQNKTTTSNSVISIQYAPRMFTSSLLLLHNAIYAYSIGITDCALFIFVCWMNSINYWRNPIYGFRRNIDLVSSIVASCYHFYCAIQIVPPILYRLVMITFCGWYALALICGRIWQNEHYSSICHVNLHCTAIVFNTWLLAQLYSIRSKH